MLSVLPLRQRWSNFPISDRFSRLLHLASAAAWWKPVRHNEHAHGPVRVADVESWVGHSMKYVSTELNVCRQTGFRSAIFTGRLSIEGARRLGSILAYSNTQKLRLKPLPWVPNVGRGLPVQETAAI